MIGTLDKIRRSGGSISVLDGRLRIEAPAGTLSDQDRQVLAQHRETLLRLFAPAEPVVVDQDLDQERQAIRWVETLDSAEGERVVEQAVRALDRLTGRDQEPEVEIVEDFDQWLRENTIEPIGCGKCGSVDQWQSLAGTWRCLKCDPPLRAQIIREQAQRLRQRYSNLVTPARRRPEETRTIPPEQKVKICQQYT